MAQAGSEAACREILRRYKGFTYRLVYSHVGDADEAFDLTQEAFVSAFAAIHRYDGARPFRLWIARIALNKCRDWARRRKVRAFFARALPLDTAVHVAAEAPPPDRQAGDRAELARVRAAMAALPPRLREVLLLRGVEEMSQAEAAATLGVSQKTVETRLYRARQQLRDALDEKQDGGE
ncbi:RNA polymerase sigma factor [Sphingopyxis sp. MWB1]|uniref:RNA polymerase sigma factor n=1 Tax=Sphingopyxis sp. MWB1 TaxID=1537715 RepID=UPI00068E419B|nr:RNA polymerase sigma factor [Sphingopyxis sp. MWB1]